LTALDINLLSHIFYILNRKRRQSLLRESGLSDESKSYEKYKSNRNRLKGGDKMKKLLAAYLFFSLMIFMGVTGVDAVTSLPTLSYSGTASSTATAGTVSLTVNAGIDAANYLDGSSTSVNNSEENIINTTISLSGSTMTGCDNAAPWLVFSDAMMSIKGPDNFEYVSAGLSVVLLNSGSGWILYPPALDSSNPSTLNLSGVQLFNDTSPHQSRYIDEFSSTLNSVPTDIAGMTMVLAPLVGDLCSGGTFNVLGIVDGAPLYTPPTNNPPIADAGVDINQTCIGSACDINLDGSQSSDIDSTIGTNDDIVKFEWFIDANNDEVYEPSELIATGETVSVSLPFGFHDIVLVVEDSQGITADDLITVVIDPAELSFLEIVSAHVKRDGKVKISGKLALPSGVSHLTMNSVGQATIAISSLGNVIDGIVDFTERANGDKWKFNTASALGITKFHIDWKGSKFNYQNGPLTIKTRHIGDDETELRITSCEAVTIDINGAIITIDEANDNVSCSHSGSKIDRDDDGDSDDSDSDGGRGHHSDDDGDCSIGVRLPFALTPDMVVSISGSVNDSILVGDYYTAAVGKFKLHGRFDVAGITLSDLSPKTLDLTIALGDEGYSALLGISETTWRQIKANHWKYKSH